MLLIAFAGVSLALVPVFGGRLAALADLRLRSFWLLLLSYLLQTVAISVSPSADGQWRGAVLVLSYVVAACFLVLNRDAPGMWLIALGTLMNTIAIVANGGVMPASAGAIATSGVPVEPGVFANSGVLAHPNLLFLGDVFAIPAGWPLANVFSAGDVCIGVGAAVAIHRTTGSRLFPTQVRAVVRPRRL